MATATNPRTFTKAEAKAHDAIVAEQYRQFRAAAQRFEDAYEAGHRAAGDVKIRPHAPASNRDARWSLQRFQVVAKLRREGSPALAVIDQARAQFEAAEAELDRLEDVRRASGNWQRFYLVTGGHIHASRSCHTLRPSTNFGWLPELSGEDEESAVLAHGPLLCTVCFPSAPVEWTRGVEAPDDQCPGSLSYDYDRATARLGYCAGNYGVCSHCGARVTVTKSNKLRKHTTP